MTEFSGEIHPVADLFPMLPDDELKDLATDITERGLLQPIVLDNKGRILDGRNRYSACVLAGVEPEFANYDGDDPDGYALAVNIARRHLNKGQQAMVIAKAGVQYLKNTDLGVSKQRVSYARSVLQYAPDLVEAVADGTKPLNEAYKTAQDRKHNREDADAKLARLRAEAPDLADDVTWERLTLDDAFEVAKHRATVLDIDELRAIDGAPAPSFAERVEQGAITWAEAAELAKQWKRERNEAIDRNVARVQRITEGWGAFRDILQRPKHPHVLELWERIGAPDKEVLDRILSEIEIKKGGGA